MPESYQPPPGPPTGQAVTYAAPPVQPMNVAAPPQGMAVPGLEFGQLPDMVSVIQTKDGECLEALGQATFGAKFGCNPCENNNKFRVYDATQYRGQVRMNGWDFKKQNEGNELVLIEEDTSFLCRCCCGGNRSYNMDATTKDGKRLWRSTRYFRCTNSKLLFPNFCCFLQEVDIFGEDDTKKIGRIEEAPCGSACCGTNFNITDENGTLVNVMRTEGLWQRCMACQCCAKSCYMPEFDIYDAPDIDLEDRKPQTLITNAWMGWALECCTDAEDFMIDFAPVDKSGEGHKNGPAPQERRHLHLAATIFLKYLYFERDNEEGGDAL